MTARQTLIRDLLVLFAFTGWALALPHYGSEFVVSMALTCLMYVALSSSWGLFCGSTRYLSLATSAFFGIGLGLSGVAGCLLSMAYTITPAMGEPYTVTALIVITLGGFGSMSGALAGGLLLGVIEALGMHFTNPSLKALLSYSVFIAVLLLRPKGLFAK